MEEQWVMTIWRKLSNRSKEKQRASQYLESTEMKRKSNLWGKGLEKLAAFSGDLSRSKSGLAVLKFWEIRPWLYSWFHIPLLGGWFSIYLPWISTERKKEREKSKCLKPDSRTGKPPKSRLRPSRLAFPGIQNLNWASLTWAHFRFYI